MVRQLTTSVCPVRAAVHFDQRRTRQDRPDTVAVGWLSANLGGTFMDHSGEPEHIHPFRSSGVAVEFYICRWAEVHLDLSLASSWRTTYDAVRQDLGVWRESNGTPEQRRLALCACEEAMGTLFADPDLVFEIIRRSRQDLASSARACVGEREQWLSEARAMLPALDLAASEARPSLLAATA